MKLDTSGNLHADADGRFAGHIHTEASADLISGPPMVDDEEVRAAQQAADAARKLLRHAWAQDRLAGIRHVVAGIKLPTDRHPRGTISFGLAGNPGESIRQYIEAVPSAQNALNDARARLRELHKSIADFPTLPQPAKEAIAGEARRQQREVETCQRNVRYAKDNLHMALWEARMEIERLEAELGVDTRSEPSTLTA